MTSLEEERPTWVRDATQMTPRLLDRAVRPSADLRPLSRQERAALVAATPERDDRPNDSNTRRHRPFSRTLVLADGLALLLSGVIAADVSFLGPRFEGNSIRDLAFVIAGLWAGWMFTLWSGDSRDRYILGFGMEEYRRVIASGAWVFVGVVSLAYLSHEIVQRRLLLTFLLSGFVLLLTDRWVCRKQLQRARINGHVGHQVLLVDGPESIDRTATELGREAAHGFRVVSRLVRSHFPPSVTEVVAAARNAEADTVVLGPGLVLDPEWTRQLGWGLEDSGLTLLIAPPLVDIAAPRLDLVPVHGMPLVRVEPRQLSLAARTVKRTVDVVGSLVGLVLLAVPMAIIYVAVRLNSRGPGFYTQRRVGIRGEEFVVYKFRTMFVDADKRVADLQDVNEACGPLFKLHNDPRVTSVGRFLRRTSLDELPQLLNVLKGDMSLVGPRPPLPSEVAAYQGATSRRLLVRPGMTGLWQVSGRSDLDWETSVRLDLYYVDNWSVAVDIALLAKTATAVVRGTGAY